MKGKGSGIIRPIRYPGPIIHPAGEPMPWDYAHNPDGSGSSTGGDFCILSCTWQDNAMLWECNNNGQSCPGTYQGCTNDSYMSAAACANDCNSLCGCGCQQSGNAGGACTGNWGWTDDASNCLGYTDTPNDPNSACTSVSEGTC